MHLIRGNQGEDRSNTLIPKQPLKPHNLSRFNLFNLPEVDDRHLLQAEHAIQLEFFKGSS